MNLKTNLYLGFKSLKKLSLKKKVFIAIEIIMLVLILIPFAVFSLYFNFFNDANNRDIDSRIIHIVDKEDKYEEYKKLLNKYDKKHISYIKSGETLETSAYETTEYANKKMGSYYVVKDIKGLTPKVNKGKYPENENEIIMPDKGGNYNVEKTSELINYKRKIGEDITFYFRTKDEEIISKTYKIVGTYDSSFYINFTDGYLNDESFDSLANELGLEKEIHFEKEEKNENRYYQLFTIYVDDYRNLKKVEKDLVDLGMPASAAYFEEGILGVFLSITLALSILFTIGSALMFINYLTGYYKTEYKSIALYKALGYKNKDIIKILASECMALIIYAAVFVIPIYIIITLGVELYFKQFVGYNIVRISLPIIPLFCYFGVLLLLNYLFIKADINEIDKLAIRKMNEL